MKNLGIKELAEKIKGLKKDIANLVMEKNMKKLKDLKMISKKRKETAQMLTLIRQKEFLMKFEKEKKAVVDDSAGSTESKKKGRTELSKNKK